MIRFAVVMMKKIGLGLLLLLAVLLVLVAWNGAFATVNIQKGKEGGYRIAGYHHRGAYKNIGAAFGKVSALTEKAFGKPSQAGEDFVFAGGEVLGLYFDDPKTVAEDSLRSFASVVVPTVSDSLALVKADPSVVFMYIPKGDAYFCDLKTTGMMSMIIAAMKAYPALGEYVQANPPQRTITHVFEVYRQGYTRFVMCFP